MPYTVVDKGSKYFDSTLYSGNDGTQSITSLNFKPDFLWIKSRNTAINHQLIDVIRGNTKQLNSSDVAAESSPTYPFTSTFDTNGWTMTNGSLSGGNLSGRTYVAWSWLGGGTGVSNTSGTISSTVSANTTSGFSIVTYTGNSSSSATVGHGLGITPSMILNKCRTGANAAQAFFIYHKGLSANNMIAFNTNAQAGTGTYSSGILSTSPTSTTFGFTAGSGGVINVNESSSTYVSYCFAEVKGFSKFGSYTGNGSTDGTFIYTGFKPAFVMVKASSTTGQWAMCDTKRGVAPSGEFLFAEATDTTNSAPANWDFLSNGFKARANYAAHNTSGVTYIYMAFAENPFVSSKGIACTAR